MGRFGSRPSRRDISPDHIQVVSCSFERLLRIVARNKSRVVVKGQISFAPEAIKDGQQTGMFLVDACPHKFNDSDVVSRLASGAESMTEHEPEGCLEHCFVRLLKTGLFVKSQNLVGRSELLVPTREKAFDLRPVNGVGF